VALFRRPQRAGRSPASGYKQLPGNCHQFENEQEPSAWNDLFLPIIQGT